MSFNQEEPAMVTPKTSLKGALVMSNLADAKIEAPPPRSLVACRKPRPDLNSMTARQYLEYTVGPILLHGLRSVALDRPVDPVTYLATYLLKNKNRCDDIAAELETKKSH